MMHETFRQRLLTAALVTMALGAWPMHLSAAQPPPAAEPQLPAILTLKPVKPAPGDDELRKLLIARYNAAVAEMEARVQEFRTGRGAVDDFLGVARRLLDSGLALSDNPAERLALREKFLAFAIELEKMQKARFEAARIGPAELDSARYLRLDAEVQVLQAKRKAATQQPK